MSRIHRGLRIVAAATRYRGVVYAMAPPARHGDLNYFIEEETGVEYVNYCQHGFLDNEGNFRDRVTAKLIAQNAGQIIRPEPITRELFSENLW